MDAVDQSLLFDDGLPGKEHYDVDGEVGHGRFSEASAADRYDHIHAQDGAGNQPALREVSIVLLLACMPSRCTRLGKRRPDGQWH